MISPANRPSKKIIYFAIAAAVVVILIFALKTHTASHILGERGLSYQAAPINNPCPDEELSPGSPCVTGAIKTTVSEDKTDNSNLTKNLSKTFFTSYLNAQSNGGDISDENRIKVIQDTVTTAPPATPALKYTMSGLAVFDPKNAEEIKAYGNEFAQIYRNKLAAYAELDQPNFDQSAEYYKNLAEALSRVKVPREVAEIHLDLLNSYNQMNVALIQLAQYENDPLKGFYALLTFRQNEDIVPTYLARLADYFKTSGIIFAKSEPGSFWIPQ